MRVSTFEVFAAAAADKRISELLLGLRRGTATSVDGWQTQIGPGHCHILDDHTFDPMTRITSRDAGANWLEQYELIWQTLNRVIVLNFMGSYETDLIIPLVRKCVEMKIFAFTYFSTPSFVKILENIQSSALVELTAHVNGTNDCPEDVFRGLALLGERVKCKLGRLMLIFGQYYNGGDIGDEAMRTFGNVLKPRAEVFLLYGYESERVCMKRLFTFGYSFIAKISMAENSPFVSEVDLFLIFETYYIFQKNINGITFNIGVRKRSCQPRNFDPPVNRAPSILDRFTPIVEFEKLDIFSRENQHQPIGYFYNSPLGDMADPENRQYTDPLIRFPNELNRRCCKPRQMDFADQSENRPHFFYEPAWDTVRITKVVYLERDTRFLLSNGLIFQLDKMDLEKPFYKSWIGRVTKRVVFCCTTQNRRYIEAIGLLEALCSITHIDFEGKWFAKILENITERLPPSCTSITTMRVKIDNTPSRDFFNFPHRPFRQNVVKYCYDSRDTIEDSLASCLNGITYHQSTFEKLESLFLCARYISDQMEYCGILRRSSVDNIVWTAQGLTVEGAVITILVHEQLNLDAISYNVTGDEATTDLRPSGFKIVFVPGIYSNRDHGYFCGFMRQRTVRVAMRTYNFIDPIPEC